MLISLVFIEQCTYEFITKKWVIMATAESVIKREQKM